MYRLHGAIHAYGGTTVSARDTADSVISAISPAAWYRNATGVTSAGGFASQWDDYSGNTRHLVQATGTNQPAYAAGVFTFDGADHFLRASAFTLNQPVTIFGLVMPNTWTDHDWFFDGNTINSGRLSQRSATPQTAAYAGGGAEVGLGSADSAMSLSAWHVFTVVFSGGVGTLRIDDGNEISGAAGGSNMGGFIMGGNPSGGGFSAASWREAVLFNSALSAADQSDVRAALAAL